MPNFQKEICLVSREIYKAEIAIDPTAPDNVFKLGQLYNTDLLEEDCKNVLGKEWRTWEAEEWDEWHFVQQIGGGKHKSL